MHGSESTSRRILPGLAQGTRHVLAGLLNYLWSGWAAIARLCMFSALWEGLPQSYGPLVLPGPLETLAQLKNLFTQGILWPEFLITAQRTLIGLGLALLAGTFSGLAAGLSLSTALLARPLVTLCLGMPPIAWLVLAMIWFGMEIGRAHV